MIDARARRAAARAARSTSSAMFSDGDVRRAAARPRCASASGASTSTPFAAALRDRRLDGQRVVVERERPARTRASRPRSRGRRSRSRRRGGCRPARVEQELEAEPRRRVRAGAERAAGVDHDRRSRPASGSSHGGPTQSGPIRTGRWNARQRSSQPSSTSDERAPPNAAQSRSSPPGVGVGDQLDAAAVVDAPRSPPGRARA